MEQFSTPILFIVFNRLDTAQKVFESIKLIRPKYLFVAADGPRVDVAGEKQKCEDTRAIIKQIDWDCDIKTLFREKNIGIKNAVSSAITWFFNNIEEGIILEHDCLPNDSFFIYCEEILNKYKKNEQVMHVSGNFFQPTPVGKNDYYFSRIPHIWGWATWKRAWVKYNLEMNGYSEFIQNKK